MTNLQLRREVQRLEALLADGLGRVQGGHDPVPGQGQDQPGHGTLNVSCFHSLIHVCSYQMFKMHWISAYIEYEAYTDDTLILVLYI